MRAPMHTRPVPGQAVRRLLLVAAGLALCAAAVPRTAAAQETTVLRGVVSGPDGRPMGGVYVALVGDARVAALTGAGGWYELQGVPVGPQQVVVQFLGFRTVTVAFEAQSGVPSVRDVTLEMEALPLDPLDVRVTPTAPPHLQGFYDRAQRGRGFYFTSADIERMQIRQTTDLLRRVPGVQLYPMAGPFGTTYVVQMTRTQGASGTRPCPPLYFVNGMPFPVAADIGLDAFVRPEEIAAVEVYTGPARVPPQFASGPTSARCGVILVWTHSGRVRGK
jgi:hypothetical protein